MHHGHTSVCCGVSFLALDRAGGGHFATVALCGQTAVRLTQVYGAPLWCITKVYYAISLGVGEVCVSSYVCMYSSLATLPICARSPPTS